MTTVYTVRSNTGRVVANCSTEAEAKALVAQLKRRDSRRRTARSPSGSRIGEWAESENHLGHKEWSSSDGRFVITTDGWSGYSLDQRDGYRVNRVGYYNSLGAAKSAANTILKRPDSARSPQFASWEDKAKYVIGELSRQSYEQAQRTKAGGKHKRHVPYSIPDTAKALVAALGLRDPREREHTVKSILMHDYDAQGVLGMRSPKRRSA